jgi:hypothetical protein
LFPHSRWDFVGVDGEVSGGQVDHRFQADLAAIPKQGAQSPEEHRSDVSTRAMPVPAVRATSLR